MFSLKNGNFLTIFTQAIFSDLKLDRKRSKIIKCLVNHLLKKMMFIIFNEKSLNFFVFVAIVLQKNIQNLAFLHFELKLYLKIIVFFYFETKTFS